MRGSGRLKVLIGVVHGDVFFFILIEDGDGCLEAVLIDILCTGQSFEERWFLFEHTRGMIIVGKLYTLYYKSRFGLLQGGDEKIVCGVRAHGGYDTDRKKR
jgi:hypothetical protein